MKKEWFLIFIFFYGNIFLFASPRQESIMIINLSNEELIINYEYHELLGEETRIAIDVLIRYTTPTTTWLLRPNKFIEIISYIPIFNLDENPTSYYYDRLAEIPFSEKAKAFFKSFSVYTTDGECIIRDIDELCAANHIIKQDRNGYNLVFFDSGAYYTNEEQEQAINAVIWPNGS